MTKRDPDSPHHLVRFAARHAIGRLKTFDVFSALARAENLVGDAERLLELQTHVKGSEFEFGTYRTTYEIFSYFAVGFVACLEWHARSRLVDLLTFKPACMNSQDFDNHIKNDAPSQMMAHNVTVAHLIVANKSVSKAKDYVDVFDRIFKALSIRVNIERDLRDTKAQMKMLRSDTLYGLIEDLFEFRHGLVHEIESVR